MKRYLVLSLLALTLGACATTSEPETASTTDDDFAAMLFSGGRVNGAELDRRIAEAVKHPLGSKENPVRVNMPPGQRAYLSRLRCSDGKAPVFERVGNFGPGVYDSIIDGYDVRCLTGSPAQSMIFMDMYHPQHNETGAPAGFTIVPAALPTGGGAAAGQSVPAA